MKPLEGLLYIWMKALSAAERRPLPLSALRTEEVRNILAVSSTALGDTLLSTPALRAVRKGFPKARITALFNIDNMELFADNPNIDGCVPYHGGYKKFFSTARALKRYGFDLALIFHGNEPQAAPLCFLSGARYIIKLPNLSPFSFLLSNRRPLAGWEGLGHGIEARLKIAELAGCRPDGAGMELFLNRADEDAADAFLEKEGAVPGSALIGFQPGASTLSRQWFPERYMELGRRLLVQSPDVKVVLTGSPSEIDLCRKIAGGINERVIISAGALSLRAGAALIKRLKSLVTGDTGPMHMAIALGTPVVALYAVSDPAITGPLHDKERHRVIKKPRTCDPCVSKKCSYQRCMEAITVDEVFEAVLDAAALKKAKPARPA